MPDPPLLPDHGGCTICGSLNSQVECVQHVADTGHEVVWTTGRAYQGG